MPQVFFRFFLLFFFLMGSPSFGGRKLVHPAISFSSTIVPNNPRSAPWHYPIDQGIASWKHYSRIYTISMTNISDRDQNITVSFTLERAYFRSNSGGNSNANLISQVHFRRWDHRNLLNLSGAFARRANLSFPTALSATEKISAGKSAVVAVAVEYIGPLRAFGTPVTEVGLDLKLEVDVAEDKGAITSVLVTEGRAYNISLYDGAQSNAAAIYYETPLNGGRPF